jgi:hypothetical protein
MFNLQLLNSQQHLLYLVRFTWYALAGTLYLVRFSLSLMILYVDPWISLPWRLVNMVTSVFLPCLTEIINTDFAQVRKSNIRWIYFHPCKDVFNLGHGLYSINIDIYVKQFFASPTAAHFHRKLVKSTDKPQRRLVFAVKGLREASHS